MSKFKRFILFVVLIIVSAIMLWGVTRVDSQLKGMIKTHHLRFSGQVKDAPPLVAFTTVALGSFRGLIADLLWLRAGGLQERGSYFEMVQLARWITDLQPTFSGATSYLAWNMAYNISVTCSSFEDRWRWVNEGIKLIRDRALNYNPEDPVLYKELGWIFQHKLGNVMDDANLFYKNKLAIQMTEYLGINPDIEALAAAPLNDKEFEELYDSKSPIWKALKDANIENLAQLYKEFKIDGGTMPAKFVELLNDPELAKKVEDFLRAKYLRDDLKLDPRLMAQIDLTYGKLDWRVPESQAIYWATKGLEKTPGNRDLSCERMITQSLYEAFRSGRLMMTDPKNFASVVTIPNLELVDSVKDTYEKAYEENGKQSSFRSAKINFMKEAITILFNYGKFSKAQEYFNLLAKEDGDPKRYGTMERFVMARWAENVRDATVKKANDIISGLIYRSLYYLVYGENDAALANERIARFIYNSYIENTAKGQEERVGLLPYAKIKEAVVNNCQKTFPPAMAAILQAKLKEEQAAAAAESKPKE